MKAGGTTRRPLVLQMDRGVFLFSGVVELAPRHRQADGFQIASEVQHARPESNSRTT
jgi:hypothetical protein